MESSREWPHRHLCGGNYEIWKQRRWGRAWALQQGRKNSSTATMAEVESSKQKQNPCTQPLQSRKSSSAATTRGDLERCNRGGRT
uniref:Uncharacterized protein n=1 Tax=Arundo donax TaxID=35708 RepID=A0A0A9FHS9_ARUDO